MQNAIALWAGTNANIPDGWSRVTDLDGKFAKGTADATDPGTVGGSATGTHNHTSSSNHGHTVGAHTHPFTVGAASGSVATGGTSSGALSRTHTHVGGNTGAVSGGGLSSVSITYSTETLLPPYYELIYIKSDGSTGLPDDAIILWDDSTLPSGFAFCDGNNGTPDLRDKFIRGAAPAGNAGGTGGASTHTHDMPHTHSETAHGHSSASSGGSTGPYTDYETASGTADSVPGNHSHTVTFGTSTMGWSGEPDTSATNHEPLHRKLLAIQNQNGTHSTPNGAIFFWEDTLASISDFFYLCDGTNGTYDMRGYYVKIGANTSDIGGTDGANTHNHVDSHTHTGGSHTHSGSTVAVGNTHNSFNDNNKDLSTGAHTHPVTVSSASANWNSTEVTSTTDSNEPRYYTLAFVKYNAYLSTTAGTTLLEDTEPDTSAGTADFDAALEPAQGKYRWIIHDIDQGKDLGDVTEARGKAFNIYLNQESTAQFTLNATNALASSEFISLGRKELHIYRNNDRVWGGELTAYEGTLGASEEDFTITARSFESLFKDRYTGAARQFNAVDAGQIAWTLINESQQLTQGDFGVTSGEIQATTNRTRLYEYKNIYQAITELAEVDNGIDWEITPYKVFNVYLSKGTDRSGDDLLEYGGNVEEVRFSYDFTEPGNRAIVLGKGSGASITYADEFDSTSRSLYKLRERIVPYKDVDNQDVLDARAERTLNERKDPVETLEVTQARGAGILAFTRVNVGDHVWVKVRHGIVNVNNKYRIRGLNVEIADDGTERVTYILTNQPKVQQNFYDVIRDIENQLAIWAATNYALAS